MNLEPYQRRSGQDLPPLARTEVEAFRELVRDGSRRKESSAFIVEGPHLVERAFQTDPKNIQLVALTDAALQRDEALVRKMQKANIQFSHITAKQSEKISDTKTPQGIFARVTFRSFPVSSISRDSGCILALDGVQDPGNVGTIIRTAAWFGVKHILLGIGCADVYLPKALRSTQGEIFSVTTYGQINLPEAVTNLKSRSYYVVGTTLSDNAGSIYRTTPRKNSVVIFGSEAHGISDALVALSDEQVLIPRIGSGESLNVATSVGIILSELTRHR